MPDQRLKDIRVLAMDDDADISILVKTILERSGAYTTVLEVIKKIRPDILICDLAMPQMDGYEVLGNVRRLEPEVGWLPVIAFTA
jgi:CheY-like chemotaxis protein